MSGVITQLSSVGKQDADTFVDPSVTFWKGVSKRHTQFAMEPKNIEFQGSYGYAKTSSALFPRNGDLFSKMWVKISLGRLDSGNGGARYVDDVGRYIIEDMRLEMGSVKFDNQYAEKEHGYEEISKLREKQLRRLTGKSESVGELTDWAKNTQTLYIPVNFFCFRNWEQSLPIIALHLADCKLYVKLRNKADIIRTTSSSPYTVTSDDAQILDMSILAETVFLDDAERDWFAETEHKYVISQTQSIGSYSVLAGVRESKIDLNLNHPVKYLMVLYRKTANLTTGEPFDFSGEETGQYEGEAFKTMSLKLNNNDRIEKQDPFYYRIVQPLQHFSRKPDKHVYVYAFALYPEDQNPSGSLNFSRIDNSKLLLEYTSPISNAADVLIFAENINSATVAAGVILLKFAA